MPAPRWNTWTGLMERSRPASHVPAGVLGRAEASVRLSVLVMRGYGNGMPQRRRRAFAGKPPSVEHVRLEKNPKRELSLAGSSVAAAESEWWPTKLNTPPLSPIHNLPQVQTPRRRCAVARSPSSRLSALSRSLSRRRLQIASSSCAGGAHRPTASDERGEQAEGCGEPREEPS